jgi:hypothetical protein
LACGIVAGPLFVAVWLIQVAALEQRGWVAACAAAVVAVLVLESWPDLDSLSVRLVIGTATIFGLVAALAARLMSGPSGPVPPRGHHHHRATVRQAE